METIEITQADFEEIKRILSNHTYSPEELQEARENPQENLNDTFAFDHAIILEILCKYE